MIFSFMTVLGVTPEETLYEYGVLGVVLVAVSYFAYKMFNIILSDRDKAVSDRDNMLQDLFTKVLPAIARNTEVLEGRQEIDRQLVEVIKDSNKALDSNTKAFDEARLIFQHGQNNGRSRGA